VRLLAGARRRRWDAAALAAVVFAMAWLAQGPTVNGNSHQALVRALADGTARIDETRFEVGDLGTTDTAWYGGHWYSNKAPGLAFVTLPAYFAVEAAGQADDPARTLWALCLLGCVVPAAVLLVLIRRVCDRVQPGLGTATAVLLGLGTLILPFSTLLFAHVLSATLAYAAFVLLWHERGRGEHLGLVAAAGLVAALAATTEYPVGIVGLILLLYAAARRGAVRRTTAYAAGGVVGLIPLAAYNWWALGSPLRLTYRYGVFIPGESRRDVLNNEVPFSTLWNVPSLHDVVRLLFFSWGLVTAAPILALSALGVVLLWRRRLRAEALVSVAVAVAFVLYSAGYYEPFGDTWAPRFLVPVIPFLALPLVCACARYPGLAAPLGAASIAVSAVVTATHPILALDRHVLDRLFSARLVGHSSTVVELAGHVTWWDTLPFFAAVLFAGGFAVAAIVRRAGPVEARDAAAGVVALLGWALFAQLIPRVAFATSGETYIVLGLAAAVVAAVAAVLRLAPVRARRDDAVTAS
jgi:hypothetical protein